MHTTSASHPLPADDAQLVLPGDEVIPLGAGGFRSYRVTVKAIQPLSPHFTRIELTGDDLIVFGTDRLDQRIKLVLPLPDGRLSEVGFDDPETIRAGEWYQRWRELPESEQSPIRTYTVRDIDPSAHTLTVDFVLHEHAGPAGTFAEQAAIGDELVVIGPDARSEHSALGIDFHRGSARNLLLAGDETAAPAIAAVLEQLSAEPLTDGDAASSAPRWNVHAFIEVPTASDRLPLRLAPGIDVQWLARDDREHGEPLADAVESFTAANPEFIALGALPAGTAPQRLEDVDIDRDLLWEAPAEVVGGHFYAWIAGESSVVKRLRRHLVRDHGVDRARVAFMGYWRQGRAEG